MYIREACQCIWQFSFSIQVPVIINIFCPALHQVLYVCCSGNVNVLHRNRKWFFFRNAQFDSWFHVMAISEISRNRPEIIFWLPHRSVLSHLEEGLEKRVRLIPRKTSCSFPRLRWSVIKVDGLKRRSPPGCFDCSICDWEYKNCHLSSALTLPLHWAFWREFLMRPSDSILQRLRSWCLLSRFLPHTIHNRRIYLARLLAQIDVISICPSQR